MLVYFIELGQKVVISKGNVINDGVSKELDELRNIINNGKELLLDIQKTEAEKTGITNLKIGFNNVCLLYTSPSPRD